MPLSAAASPTAVGQSGCCRGSAPRQPAASATKRQALTPLRRTCWPRGSHHACWPRPPPAPGGNIHKRFSFLDINIKIYQDYQEKKRKTSCEVAAAVLGLPPEAGYSGGCITAQKRAGQTKKAPPSARPCTSQQAQKGKSPSHPIDEVVLNGAVRVEVLRPQDILCDLLRLVLRVLR